MIGKILIIFFMLMGMIKVWEVIYEEVKKYRNRKK
jgi:hypothetical protein